MTGTVEQVLMRIYIGEGDRHGRQPLYESLLELLRKHDLAGATVLRGIAGYGAGRKLHTDRLLELSHNLPLVVEAVDTGEKLQAALPEVREMAPEALITLEKVQVVKCKT